MILVHARFSSFYYFYERPLLTRARAEVTVAALALQEAAAAHGLKKWRPLAVA